jgi:hypothetical protein
MKLSERAAIGFQKKEAKAPVFPPGRLITRSSDGVIEARSGEGRLLGHFNPKTNETRDHRGDLVGIGNRLFRILQAADAANGREAKQL